MKRPLNLNDIVDELHHIDSDDDLPSEITKFLPENPNTEITDEDSGDEEFVTIHNFPGLVILVSILRNLFQSLH